jgi:ABC-2 type transport system ATP-binding protein
MLAIQATGLIKSYRDTTAVDGVDLAVDEGDIVGLLGPNGAGKTTTMMMLLGLIEPDAGTVRLLGRPMPEERTAALEEANFTASYVGMPDRMQVREILWVFAGIYGATRTRVDELIELFDLGPFAKRTVSQLSSGQRTLLGLAKSMLNRPRLLFLDEPTASLDPAVSQHIREILLGVHREDRFTLLITSHNMSDIERLCSRVIFMGSGRIVADGSPTEIVERYGADDLEGTFLSIATGHGG